MSFIVPVEDISGQLYKAWRIVWNELIKKEPFTQYSIEKDIVIACLRNLQSGIPSYAFIDAVGSPKLFFLSLEKCPAIETRFSKQLFQLRHTLRMKESAARDNYVKARKRYPYVELTETIECRNYVKAYGELLRYEVPGEKFVFPEIK